MSNAFYITTPIYYVNAKPHLGHAYTTIAADVACRFNRMQKRETFFLTGTDEHGDKIVEAAKKEGLSPKAYVDRISGLFRELLPQLSISNDFFVRTTDPGHIQVVSGILQKIYDSGDIYFSEYTGKYCFGCERFYMDRELIDGKCPDHGTEPKLIKESNYFFKMSRYQNWLIDHITRNPDFIRPERYRNEVLAFLREPLEDLCISRPKSRLMWGITLPFDNDYVTYVWFDALLNYVSAIGYPDGIKFKEFWSAAQHIVAKDIIKPHGIYWPIMLKAAGIPLYSHLNVHGYWNVDKHKMSKSIGNVVDPLSLKNKYGIDAFRFFLMREMVFGLDSNFNEEALIQRINADLANDLGNLFSRVLSMAHKYFQGTVPDVDPETEGTSLSLGLKNDALKAVSEYENSMSSFAFHKGLMAVWEFIGKLNKYVDTSAPWELAKKKSSRGALESVIYNLLEGLRVVSALIYPVMPGTADIMQKHLGMNPEIPYFHLDQLRRWNVLAAGTKLPKSISLFPRIDLKNWNANKIAEEPDVPQVKPEITFDDVGKLDLRVATVLKAETIPKAKKLLKLEIDIGTKRTIVAGISGSYLPEDLVGKQVIVVANLKPAKLMGVQSNGMLLAAVDSGGSTIATLDKPVPPGTMIR